MKITPYFQSLHRPLHSFLFSSCSSGNQAFHDIIDLSDQSISFSIPRDDFSDTYKRKTLEGTIKNSRGELIAKIYRRTVELPDFASYEEVHIKNAI